jgi:hypothetical protein
LAQQQHVDRTILRVREKERERDRAKIGGQIRGWVEREGVNTAGA